MAGGGRQTTAGGKRKGTQHAFRRHWTPCSVCTHPTAWIFTDRIKNKDNCACRTCGTEWALSAAIARRHESQAKDRYILQQAADLVKRVDCPGISNIVRMIEGSIREQVNHSIPDISNPNVAEKRINVGPALENPQLQTKARIDPVDFLQNFPMPLRVRRTFIEVEPAALRSPSLQAFVRERRGRSCPAREPEGREGNSRGCSPRPSRRSAQGRTGINSGPAGNYKSGYSSICTGNNVAVSSCNAINGLSGAFDLAPPMPETSPARSTADATSIGSDSENEDLALTQEKSPAWSVSTATTSSSYDGENEDLAPPMLETSPARSTADATSIGSDSENEETHSEHFGCLKHQL